FLDAFDELAGRKSMQTNGFEQSLFADRFFGLQRGGGCRYRRQNRDHQARRLQSLGYASRHSLTSNDARPSSNPADCNLNLPACPTSLVKGPLCCCSPPRPIPGIGLSASFFVLSSLSPLGSFRVLNSNGWKCALRVSSDRGQGEPGSRLKLSRALLNLGRGCLRRQRRSRCALPRRL